MAKKYKDLEKLLAHVPRYSYTINGIQMEPITVIILGRRKAMLKLFAAAGWYVADPINLLSAFRSGAATLLNSSYRTGPMWPAYLRGRRNQIGLERPTVSDTYRRRHHMRLWKINLRYRKTPVWVGTISYDRGVGHFKNSLVPLHHISSTLLSEENFLARTFRIGRPEFITLAEPEKGHINTGDPYIWDGKAILINLAHED